MAKKKKKLPRKKRTKKKTRKKKPIEEKEKVKAALEISQTTSDVKTFIEKFRTDVKKRRKAYQSFAQKLRRKK